jgi:hypothetical protein
LGPPIRQERDPGGRTDADHQNDVAARLNAFRRCQELLHLGRLGRIVVGYGNDPDRPPDAGGA